MGMKVIENKDTTVNNSEIFTAINEASKHDERTKEKVKKEKKDDQVIIRFPDGLKDQYKLFFMKNGKSLSEGIRIATDYLYQKCESGQCKITPSGIWESTMTELLK